MYPAFYLTDRQPGNSEADSEASQAPAASPAEIRNSPEVAAKATGKEKRFRAVLVARVPNGNEDAGMEARAPPPPPAPSQCQTCCAPASL